MRALVRASRVSSRIGTLWREFVSAPRDTWNKAAPANVLLFSSDADLTTDVAGQAICRVLDPLAAEFNAEGYSTLAISYRGGKLVGQQTGSSLLSISRLLIVAEMRDALRNALVTLLGFEPGKLWSATERAYSSLFKRLNPKLLLVIDADPLICSVAGKHQIPVLEVLHARGYGDVYEGWKKRSFSQLPDGVVAYDDLSAKVFERLLPVLRVPNFRLPFELEVARQFLKVSPPPFAPIAKQFRHVILFTASYKPEDPSWSGGLPAELVELAQENSDLFLLVRLHPVMQVRPEYEKAREALNEEIRDLPNSDTVWASTAPLYAVLEVSTIHFTYDSMSAYEAADVGLLSYAHGISGSANEEHMLDLRSLGFVTRIQQNKPAFEAALKYTTSQKLQLEHTERVDLNKLLDFANASAASRWAVLEDR